MKASSATAISRVRNALVMVSSLALLPVAMFGWRLFGRPDVSLAAGAGTALFLFLLHPISAPLYRNWLRRDWIGRDNAGAWLALVFCAALILPSIWMVATMWKYYASYAYWRHIDVIYLPSLILTGATIVAIAFAKKST